jgi:hypothetical protein
VQAIDWQSTSVNALSSGIPSRIRVPVHFASDRACLEWVSATAGKTNPADVTYGWIRNTLALDCVVMSENLRAQVESQAHAEVEAELQCRWDERQDLISPLLAEHADPAA